MIKFVFPGLTITALVLAGCSSQPTVSSAAQSKVPILEKVSPPPAAEAPSDSCSNLDADYASSPIKPEVVIYGENTLRKFPIGQIDEALKFYFSQKKPEQDLLLYVHGRALGNTKIGDFDHEPEESRTDAIPAFSSKYKIDATIMLHWPHRKLDDTGFPESDAKSSGKALACVIQRLNSADFGTGQYPGFRALITHSMGALVLEEALTSTSEDLHGFNAVVVAAAASRPETASAWLPKIAANQRFVLINTHDVVLREVNQRKHFLPLGKCDSDCLRANQPTPSIVYLDITDIAGTPFNVRHNYFVKGKVADRIITKILRGETPPKGSQGAYENIRIIKD